MEYDVIIDSFGSKNFYKKGTRILHREDGPAVCWADCNWKVVLEKTDFVEHKYGIAFYNVNYSDNIGKCSYFKNGEFEEYKAWYIDNKLHREDGPAVDCGQLRAWLIQGKLHREDGPAIELPNGIGKWYINGIRLSPEKESIMNIWWNNKNGI